MAGGCDEAAVRYRVCPAGQGGKEAGLTCSQHTSDLSPSSN